MDTRMFKLVQMILLFTAVAAMPQRPFIKILAQENIFNDDGSYRYSYESADGTRAQQEGRQVAITAAESGQAAQGGYSYIGTDGRTYDLTYTADARGYLAAGAHLPTPPPIPAAILRSLAYNAAHPEQDNL